MSSSLEVNIADVLGSFSSSLEEAIRFRRDFAALAGSESSDATDLDLDLRRFISVTGEDEGGEPAGLGVGGVESFSCVKVFSTDLIEDEEDADRDLDLDDEEEDDELLLLRFKGVMGEEEAGDRVNGEDGDVLDVDREDGRGRDGDDMGLMGPAFLGVFSSDEAIMTWIATWFAAKCT